MQDLYYLKDIYRLYKIYQGEIRNCPKLEQKKLMEKMQVLREILQKRLNHLTPAEYKSLERETG